MNRILVPTDFSACAGTATQAALLLAQKTGAELHFLHLMSVPADWIHMVDYAERMYADVRDRVRRANRALSLLVARAEEAGVVAKSYLYYDESYTNILNHIENRDIDLVVMGSYGASGFKEMFMGTLSQKIARQATVPVLVVKSPLQVTEFEKVVFSSDFDPETLPQFEQVVAFCREIEADLHLVYLNSPLCFTDTDTMNEKMAVFAATCPDLVASVSIYNHQNIEGGLTRFCEHLSPDMVMLLLHSRKPMYNNLVDYAISYAGRPVLCLSKEVVRARKPRPATKRERAGMAL